MANTVKRKTQLTRESTEATGRKNEKKIIIFKTSDNMADFVIAQWKTISERAIKEKGCFSVALSGGKTPVFLYKKLSHKKTLPWDKTYIFQTDERFVPYQDKENNFHMISDMLLNKIGIPRENVYPISTAEDASQLSAERYERNLRSFFEVNAKPPRFDLVLLGIGQDGHTASLFPAAQAVKERKRLAVATAPLNKKENERITITFPVINNAENVMFLVTGNRKAKIVKEVIDDTCDLLPASMVKPESGKLFFLLDASAGSLLES